MMRIENHPGTPLTRATFGAAVLAVALLAHCGSDNSGPPPSGTGGTENAGSSCTAASQCYPGVFDAGIDGAVLMGAVVCMDKVPGGYCTHKCTADTDCCAVPGECIGTHPQVCSPFESTADQYCFLSCEDAQVTNSGVVDANAYCATYGNSGLSCRSSGGGSKNRKVCMP